MFSDSAWKCLVLSIQIALRAWLRLRLSWYWMKSMAPNRGKAGDFVAMLLKAQVANWCGRICGYSFGTTGG
jgi:hypothetical protein